MEQKSADRTAALLVAQRVAETESQLVVSMVAPLAALSVDCSVVWKGTRLADSSAVQKAQSLVAHWAGWLVAHLAVLMADN